MVSADSAGAGGGSNTSWDWRVAMTDGKVKGTVPPVVMTANPPEEPHVTIGNGKIHLSLLKKIGHAAAIIGEKALEIAIDAAIARVKM